MKKNGKMIPCKICKKRIYVSVSRIKSKKTCSKNCRDKWMSAIMRGKNRNGKMIPCKICNKKMYITPSLIRSKKTCSRNCHAKWIGTYPPWNKGIKYKMNPKKKIGHNIPCEICNKRIYVTPSLEQKKTCSIECFSKWKSLNAKELGYGKWMKGRKRSKRITEKIKITKLQRIKDGWVSPSIGRPSWNKGIPHTEEHKKKLKETRKYQKSTFTSSIEIKIQNFLKQLGIEFFTHQYMKEIKHGYQCDILIPCMNLVIECDGNYWHKYPVGNEMDHIRTSELLEKGFKVLRLWESEIKTMNINSFKEELALVRCK